MAETPHVMIIEAPYYTHIAEAMAKGAIEALDAARASYERFAVPGALEIPVAIRIAIEGRSGETKSGESKSGAGRRFDGYVALGCVIRGETHHFDIVANESARGLQALALQYGVAIGNGIITVENEAQALARARLDRKNKGGEAARACLALIELRQHFGLKRA